MVGRSRKAAALAATVGACVLGSGAAQAQAQTPLRYQVSAVTTDGGATQAMPFVGVGTPFTVREADGTSETFVVRLGVTGGAYTLGVRRLLAGADCGRRPPVSIRSLNVSVALDDGSTVQVGYRAPGGAPDDFQLTVDPTAIGSSSITNLAKADIVPSCFALASQPFAITARLDQGDRHAALQVPLGVRARSWRADVCTSGSTCISYPSNIAEPSGSFAFRSTTDGGALTPLQLDLDLPGQLRTLTPLIASKLDAVFDFAGSAFREKRLFVDTDRATVQGFVYIGDSGLNIDSGRGWWAEDRYFEADLDRNIFDPTDFSGRGLFHCDGFHLGLPGVPGFFEQDIVSHLCNA